MRQQSRENIKKYVDERLPEEYEKCLVGVNSILKEASIMAEKAESNRDKLQALNLAKDCHAMKMDMLTNASVIDDSIRFIAANTSENNRKEKRENKGPAEDADNDEKITTNQIF